MKKYSLLACIIFSSLLILCGKTSSNNNIKSNNHAESLSNVYHSPEPVVTEQYYFEYTSSNLGGDRNVVYRIDGEYGEEINQWKEIILQPGNTLNIEVKDGFVLNDVFIRVKDRTVLGHSIDNSKEYSKPTVVAERTKYSITGLIAKKVSIACLGKNTYENADIYYVGVNYTREERGPLTKLTYVGIPKIQYEGQKFNPEGLTFTGRFKDGLMTISPDKVTFYPSTLSSRITGVIAIYKGMSVTIPVNVMNVNHAEMDYFTSLTTTNIGGDNNVYYTQSPFLHNPVVYNNRLVLKNYNGYTYGDGFYICAKDGYAITDIIIRIKENKGSVLGYDVNDGREFLNKSGIGEDFEYKIENIYADKVAISDFSRVHGYSDDVEISYLGVNYAKKDKGELLDLTYVGVPKNQYEDREFNPEGLTFIGKFEDGLITIPSTELTFNPSTLSSRTTSVNATYKGMSITIPVNVMNVNHAEMDYFTTTQASNIGGDSNVYYGCGNYATLDLTDDNKLKLDAENSTTTAGYFYIRAKDGYVITDISFGLYKNTVLGYSLYGSYSCLNVSTVLANHKYEITGLFAEEVTIKCYGYGGDGYYAANEDAIIDYLGVNYAKKDKGELLDLTYVGVPKNQYEDREFNPEGLTFIGKFEDGLITIPSTELTFNPSTLSSRTTSVNATYKGMSITIPVNIQYISSMDTIMYFSGSGDIYVDSKWNNECKERTINSPKATFTWNSICKNNLKNYPFSYKQQTSLTIFSNSKPIKSVEIGFEKYEGENRPQTINAIINGTIIDSFNFPEQGTKFLINVEETNIMSLKIEAVKASKIYWEYVIIKYYDDGHNFIIVQNFIDNYLHPELDTSINFDTGACLGPDGYYAKAKEAFNNLTAEQKRIFVEDESYADMYARLSAWARANGETFDPSNNLVSANDIGSLALDYSSYYGLIVLSIAAVSLVFSFIIFKRKKSAK